APRARLRRPRADRRLGLRLRRAPDAAVRRVHPRARRDRLRAGLHGGEAHAHDLGGPRQLPARARRPAHPPRAHQHERVHRGRGRVLARQGAAHRVPARPHEPHPADVLQVGGLPAGGHLLDHHLADLAVDIQPDLRPPQRLRGAVRRRARRVAGTHRHRATRPDGHAGRDGRRLEPRAADGGARSHPHRALRGRPQRRRQAADDLRQGHPAPDPTDAPLPRRDRDDQHVPGLRRRLRHDAGRPAVRHDDGRVPHLPRGVPALQPRLRLGAGDRPVPHHAGPGRRAVPHARPERGVLMAAVTRPDPFLRDRSHPVKPTPLGAVVILLVLIALSLAALVPLYWMFATSLTPSAMTVRFPPELIPSDPTLDNYRAVLRQPNFWSWVKNSLIQSLSVTAVIVATASMAGYAIAKLPFRGSRLLFWLFILSMMLPFEAILVPLFLVVTRLGLVDTYLGLLLPLMAAPFAIFLMKQFIQTQVGELIDAARVDGASEPRIFWEVVLPLVRPGLAFLGIVTFVAQWNSFVWPLVVTRSSGMRTLQVGLVLIREQEPLFFGLQMAAAMLAAVPVIVVFFAFQRYFLRGVTVGALKG